jgi:hypothetical protein
MGRWEDGGVTKPDARLSHTHKCLKQCAALYSTAFDRRRGSGKRAVGKMAELLRMIFCDKR